MKYIIFIFFSFCLLLTGCSKQNNPDGTLAPSHSNTGISNSLNSGNIKIRPSRGDLHATGSTSVSGAYSLTIISGYMFIQPGIFSIRIPKNLEQRSYEQIQSYVEQFTFLEKTFSYFFVNTIEKIDTSISYDDQHNCLRYTNYNEGVKVLKKTTTKVIDGYQVFITDITLPVDDGSGKPRNLKGKHVCFVKDSILYDINMDNFTPGHMEQIEDSLHFNN